MTEREDFEKWITAPPYEQSVYRYVDDETLVSWPGQYINYAVQLAWCAWQKRGSGINLDR